AATAGALLPFAVPQLVHIGASVTNDSGMVLTGGLATVVIAYVLRGDTSRRTATMGGGIVGAGLLTKSLAVVFVPGVAAASRVAGRRAARGGQDRDAVDAVDEADGTGPAALGGAEKERGDGEPARAGGSAGGADGLAGALAETGGADTAPFLLGA